MYISDGDVQKLVLTTDDFGDKIWDTYTSVVQTLMQAGYACYTRMEDRFCIVIEFCYDDDDLARRYHDWLDAKEFDLIENFRNGETSEATDE